MPEGHTIHRLAQDLERALVGHRIEASSPQGRFPDATRLNGCVLRSTEAIGKHLLLRFSGGIVVHVHLGLFGRFRPRKNNRGTTRLRLTAEQTTWDLVGPTCCEFLKPAGVRALKARLGADPLAKDADAESAWKIVHATKRSIGAVLLDQRVFAGIGNVYRAELLFLLGIHPETPSSALTRQQFDALWQMMRELLARGVKEKRIVTVNGPTPRRRSDALHIYRRRTCRGCEGPVSKLKIANRTIYACERCQAIDAHGGSVAAQSI